MQEELHYVCFSTDSGELDLISSHQTFDEAFEELKTLSSQPHSSNGYSVKCLGNLKRSIHFFKSEIERLKQRIAKKQLARQAVREAREILRDIRETLPPAAYKVVTEKLIDLTDIIDKGERYVENRLQDIECYEGYIKERLEEIELLEAAFESSHAANQRAMGVLEDRSRIHEMKQTSNRGATNGELH